MIKKFEEKRHKRNGWSINTPINEMYVKMIEEVAELGYEINLFRETEIIKECADVANYAYIIADICRLRMNYNDLSNIKLEVPKNYISEIVTQDSFGYVSPIIFFQGCNIRCKGCHNPGLFDITKGVTKTAKDIVKDIITSLFDYKAVTYQGGEPTLQEDALFSLMKFFYDIGVYNILYTGNKLFDVPNRIKKLCHVIKVGQYGSDQHVYHTIDLLELPDQFTTYFRVKEF